LFIYSFYQKIQKDEDVLVLHDKFPIAKNHILVMPKKHIKNAQFITKDDSALSK